MCSAKATSAVCAGHVALRHRWFAIRLRANSNRIARFAAVKTEVADITTFRVCHHKAISGRREHVDVLSRASVTCVVPPDVGVAARSASFEHERGNSTGDGNALPDGDLVVFHDVLARRVHPVPIPPCRGPLGSDRHDKRDHQGNCANHGKHVYLIADRHLIISHCGSGFALHIDFQLVDQKSVLFALHYPTAAGRRATPPPSPTCRTPRATN
jgi:hypothetical protein